MRYVLLVSHGEFAPGLHKAIEMLAGSSREDVLSTSLKNGMGADEFADNVREILKDITDEDEIALFADIVGGSPLTTAANVIAEKGLLDRTVMVGGMNLPLVLSTILTKDFAEDFKEHVRTAMVAEAKEMIQEFTVAVEEESDDI
ncbi:MAG: PTS fructose transporter subunit IIA [Erysipelotrichaceae bacterium]|jgi:PTS system N-acetylgalactosamine-specific IIA component|nr:PTS fructose transporter subunit IIA [Erysipelotrichaceae bacterium]